MQACVLTRSANRTRLEGCMVSGLTQFKAVVCVFEGEKNDLTRGVRRWFGEIRRSDSRMTLCTTKNVWILSFLFIHAESQIRIFRLSSQFEDMN